MSFTCSEPSSSFPSHFQGNANSLLWPPFRPLPVSLMWFWSPDSLVLSLLGLNTELFPASVSVLCCLLCLQCLPPSIWRSQCPLRPLRLCSNEFRREAFPNYLLGKKKSLSTLSLFPRSVLFSFMVFNYLTLIDWWFPIWNTNSTGWELFISIPSTLGTVSDT